MTDHIRIKRALISVSDKTGIVELAQDLSGYGIELLSTGGTYRVLTEAGLNVREVSDYTGFPEMMGGRLKTLHPMVHGGLLALRDNPDHLASMERHAIAPIDLLIANLYPFENTVAAGAGQKECIENIDIGGPAMIRAAAKNHGHVTVVTDPADYAALRAEMMKDHGATTLAFRMKMAGQAYARTAAYDAAIAGWFAATGLMGEEEQTAPTRMTLTGQRRQRLRYGENPHQSAALYVGGEPRPGVLSATQLQGKALSYNNINDTDAAFELVAEFEKPAIAIIKHANPCGVAVHDDLAEAYVLALRCDPVSAFGGIIAANRAIDGATAQRIASVFAEVVIAPEITPEAREVFAAKSNLRLLEAGALPDPSSPGTVLKAVAGGFLRQDRDSGLVRREALQVVTQRTPDDREIEDLLFAFRVAKHVKSNAIVYAKDGATAGIGAGQMSRVDSAMVAASKARDAAAEAGLPEPLTEGAVVASDAFFPFADGLKAAASAGVTAVIQPGGSIRDQEVIDAADEAGLAMVFTGMRHFRH